MNGFEIWLPLILVFVLLAALLIVTFVPGISTLLPGIF